MDDEDRRTVSADGITVEKHVDTDRFKTPAVILEIESTIDRSATVTVTEPIPEAFAIEDIGFHPEFGGEHWSIAGRTITFERGIDAGEEYTTVYGVRDITEDQITAFIDTGMSVTTDPSDDAGATADAGGEAGTDTGDGAAGDDGGEADPVEELLAEDDDEVVRDVIAGDRDSLPEMEVESGPADGDEAAAAGGDGSEEGAEEDGETEDAEGDEDAEEEVEAEPEEASGASDDESGEGESADGEPGEEEPDGEAADAETAATEYRTLPGSVAEALAAEIRDGTIAEENERVLREAFAGSTEEASGSVDARIEHLQTQVADLAAYTDELERFLDEHGGGDSALAAVEEDLADVTGTIGTIEDDIDALEEETAELESSLEELESGLEGVREDVDGLEERFEEVEELEDRIEDAETGIDDLLYLEEDVMELQDRTGDLPELEETVEELREERVTDLDDRIGGLEETVDDLASEMEDMKAFRDRLSSAFGPGGEATEE